MVELLLTALALVTAGTLAPFIARASDRKVRRDVADYRARRNA